MFRMDCLNLSRQRRTIIVFIIVLCCTSVQVMCSCVLRTNCHIQNSCDCASTETEKDEYIEEQKSIEHCSDDIDNSSGFSVASDRRDLLRHKRHDNPRAGGIIVPYKAARLVQHVRFLGSSSNSDCEHWWKGCCP